MRLKPILDTEYSKPRIVEYMGERIENAFRKNNITIEDILNNKYKLHQFLNIKNLGTRSINGIRESFKEIGYLFPDETDWENARIRNKGEELDKYLKTNT